VLAEAIEDAEGYIRTVDLPFFFSESFHRVKWRLADFASTTAPDFATSGSDDENAVLESAEF
jgi:hypothetical protein